MGYHLITKGQKLCNKTSCDWKIEDKRNGSKIIMDGNYKNILYFKIWFLLEMKFSEVRKKLLFSKKNCGEKIEFWKQSYKIYCITYIILPLNCVIKPLPYLNLKQGLATIFVRRPHCVICVTRPVLQSTTTCQQRPQIWCLEGGRRTQVLLYWTFKK